MAIDLAVKELIEVIVRARAVMTANLSVLELSSNVSTTELMRVEIFRNVLHEYVDELTSMEAELKELFE
jgi:hypothetical protein